MSYSFALNNSSLFSASIRQIIIDSVIIAESVFAALIRIIIPKDNPV